MKNRMIIICVITGFLLCACGSNSKNTEINVRNSDIENIQEKDSSSMTTPTAQDMVLVQSVDELCNQSDQVVKATIEKKTKVGKEATNAEIVYELKINECIKGDNKVNEINLKVSNNDSGIYEDRFYYDFNEGETYIFFLCYDANEECYYITSQTTGLIKILDDNKVEVQKKDHLFNSCKTYEDVISKLNFQSK